MDAQGIAALSSMLDESRGAAEDALDGGASSSGARQGLTPGAIGAPAGAKPKAAKKPRDPKAIWEEDELPDEAGGDEGELAAEAEADELEALLAAGAELPEFEFVFRQAITMQEGYGMALDPMAKDPGSASCETLVMKIKLPGVDSAAKLDLDVTAKRVRLRSAKYALSEPLPEAVDADNGAAKFDKETCTLTLSLPIVREGEAVIMA